MIGYKNDRSIGAVVFVFSQIERKEETRVDQFGNFTDCHAAVRVGFGL